MTINEMKDTVAELDKQIETLQDERSSILKRILDKERCKNLEKFESWELNNNSTLVLFAKNSDYYKWCAIKVIRVTSIDVDKGLINVIEGNYRQLDYEFEYYTRKSVIHFSDLEEIENIFNIYHVSTSVCDSIEHELCSLLIDMSQISNKEYFIRLAASTFFS